MIAKICAGALLSLLILLQSSCAETIDGWSVSEKGNGWSVVEEERPTGSDGWYNLSETYHSPQSISISFPAATTSDSGDYAAITKSFEIADILHADADSCFLSFWVKDSFSGPTFGYHKIQALINNSDIIYDKDVATDSSAWHHILANVGEYVIGTEEKNITVSFRIYENAAVTNFPISAYFDNIMFTFDDSTNSQVRQEKLANVKMTYAGMGDGRLDNSSLTTIVNSVAACNSNIYAYLFYNESPEKNYGDRWQLYQEAALDSFKVNARYPIDSWAYLVPPSEFADYKYPEPYRDDYNSWFQEFAGLSIEHDNLTAISMDDFDSAFWNHESDKLSVANVKSYVDSLRAVNPLIPFVTVSYYNPKINFIAGTGANFPEYQPYIDAILFPFGYEKPVPPTSQFKPQVEAIRKNIGPDMLLLTDVYASHFGDFIPTPEWILDIGTQGKENTDGLGIYQLQVGDDPDTVKKIEVIKELFTDKAAQ